jgi:uncharacterized lipoprotein YbaY
MVNVRVTGEIKMPAGTEPNNRAIAHVHLLDTSLADAPSTVLARLEVENMEESLTPDGRLPFVLKCQVADDRISLSLQAHIDNDRDGKMSRGDFINVQSYPVATAEEQGFVVVETVKLN